MHRAAPRTTRHSLGCSWRKQTLFFLEYDLVRKPVPTFRDHALLLGELESHLAVAVGIVAPVLAHLDEQEEMHGLADDLGDFLACGCANRLDGGAALAHHDLPLAFALYKDRLLDADRIVLALGPAVGLDRRLIGQLLMQLLKNLLARDLGCKMAHRRHRHLVL